MQNELSSILKAFIYDAQNKMNGQEIETFVNVNNSAIIKHKGRPPKRLKAGVEQSTSKENRVLQDSMQVNVRNDNNVLEGEMNNNTKGRRCGICKQYGHYAKTCQNE